MRYFIEYSSVPANSSGLSRVGDSVILSIDPTYADKVDWYPVDSYELQNTYEVDYMTIKRVSSNAARFNSVLKQEINEGILLKWNS